MPRKSNVVHRPVRPVVPETDAIVDLRERVLAVVPSARRTTSFGRALVEMRVAGVAEWVELDTLSENELRVLIGYYLK